MNPCWVSGQGERRQLRAFHRHQALLAALYRQDVLDEAGLETPMEPTLESFAELAAQVYEATGRTQDTLVGKDALRNLLRAYGLDLFNLEGNGLGFDDPKSIVRTWQDRLDAVEAGWCLDVGETSATTAFDAMVSDNWASWHWTNELQAYQDVVPAASCRWRAGRCRKTARSRRFTSSPPCSGLLRKPLR